MIAQNIKKLLWAVATDNRYSKIACELLLHAAIDFGDLDLIKKLIDTHGYYETPNSDGYGPLHLAVFNGDSNIIKYLLEKGANPNQMSALTYETPLHFAAMHGDYDMFGLLLEYGADINLFDKKKVTALEQLLIFNHEDVLLDLFEYNKFFINRADAVTIFRCYEYSCYKDFKKASDMFKLLFKCN